MFERLKVLFGGSNRSQLGAYIRAFERQWDKGRFPSQEDSTFKIVETFSAVSLSIAEKLDRCIRNLMKAVPQSLERNPDPIYDIVTFEAAAYLYFHLIREHSVSNDEDESDHSYMGCIRQSVVLTGNRFEQLVDFLPKEAIPEFFWDRVFSYVSAGNVSHKQGVERLGHLIVASSRDGRPATIVASDKGVIPANRIQNPIDLRDDSIFAVPAAIGVWHASHVDIRAGSFRQLYEHFRSSDSKLS